jgi:uncharacterized protein YyaL (SSP411 family)
MCPVHGTSPVSNRLASEASPYLQSHADQSIDWLPWSREAFERAAREGKPILLSIGYLACYWCHVMAKESFCDAGVAETMNRHFINVKVDREERPDVDRGILDAMARLGARTGWPVTAFLTPEGNVYGGGSYYPPEARYGLPGFPEVLVDAARRYAERDISAEPSLASTLTTAGSPREQGAVIDLARYSEYLASRLLAEVDPLYGGFGLNGPKFPLPAVHELLWRIHAASGKPAFATGVIGSLTRICRSALFDHVGGGFHRYCVDEAWTEAHFEKMLYDNAQMIELLTWLWRGTGSSLFAQRIEETVGWVLCEMRIGDGGFAASLGSYSADPAHDGLGAPGTFYLWSAGELADVLGADADSFERVYEILPFSGLDVGAIAQTDILPDGTARSLLDQCCARLLARRATRQRPVRDGKILADWNGLMIVALIEAGIAFERTDWLSLAKEVFESLVAHLCDGARLRHCVTDDRRGPEGLLEDYASMSRAALKLYENFGDDRYLDFAKTWVAMLNEHFWDAERGGYFSSGDDSWLPGARLRTITETSVPSGNGMMAGVLGFLHEITGVGFYREQAERLVEGFRSDIVRHGIAVSTALNNVLTLDRFVRINVSGPPDDMHAEALLKVARASCLPDRLVLRQAGEKPIAQVCIGTTCLLPLTDVEALHRLIEPGGLAALSL